MDISRHISDLLFDNDCVIIPGLGGFVCNYQPATIHPVRHLFTPPSKLVLFNSRLKNNDGLLANQIAAAESLPYAEACEMIEEYVRETLFEIGKGNKVTLQHVGIFFADSEGNLQFNPDLTINFNKDSFGLTSFISPAVHREFRKILSRPEPKFENRRPITQHKPKKSRIVWVVAGVPIVSAIVWIGLNLNVGTNLKNQTGLMPTLPETEQTITLNKQTNRFSDLLSDNETTQLPTIKNVEILQPTPATHEVAFTPSKKMENEVDLKQNLPADLPVEKPSELVSQKKYFLIAGAFENMINAEKLIQQFKADGFQPELAGQTDKGLYRVAIAAFAKKDEALAELKKIRENYNPNVWFLKK